MACIVGRETKQGTVFYVKYRQDGKQIMERVGHKITEARARKAQIEADMSRGTHQPIRDVTFKKLADSWLKHVKASGGSKKSGVRPKTYSSYKPQVDRIIKVFGHRNVRSLRREEIKKFLADLKEQGLSDDMRGRVLTRFKTICEEAVKDGYAGVNPCRYVDRPSSSRKEMDFLSPSEVGRLINAIKDERRTIVLFAVLTGCRQSEILGLRWNDVDLVEMRANIRQVYHGGQFFDMPKTDTSRRTVELAPELVKALKEHQLRQMVEIDDNPRDLVFCGAPRKGKDGKSLPRTGMDGRSLTRWFRSQCRAAGIKDIRFHDLRHTFASIMLNAGENIKFISKQLGHASIQITIDRYSHLMRETGRDAIDRLGQTISTAICEANNTPEDHDSIYHLSTTSDKMSPNQAEWGET